MSEPTRDDKERGLYAKYEVRRLNDVAGKHDSCWFFVLDPTHDPLAEIALRAYAEAALSHGYEQLGRDLVHRLDGEEVMPVMPYEWDRR